MGRKNRRASASNHHKEYDYSYQKHGVESIYLVNRLKYKNESQALAHETIQQNILTFLEGPAGTAKTFLPCAEAVSLLEKGRIKKIIISRPTVEAGKSLGFLPGDLKNKVDPYLIPIYDNLEYFLGREQLQGLMEEEIIQVAPIQFLRGRTINDAFIILDEMQNASKEQMRLALTRLGENTKCVVTVDKGQIDLKPKMDSCAYDVPYFLGAKDIGYYRFENTDIVRSKIVARVLEVYESMEKEVDQYGE